MQRLVFLLILILLLSPAFASNIRFALNRIDKGTTIDLIDQSNKRIACGIIDELSISPSELNITLNKEVTLESRDFCDEHLSAQTKRISLASIKAVEIHEQTSNLYKLERGELIPLEFKAPLVEQGQLFHNSAFNIEKDAWLKMHPVNKALPGLFFPDVHLSIGYMSLLPSGGEGLATDLTTSWWIARKLSRWRLNFGFTFFQRASEDDPGIVQADQIYQTHIAPQYTLIEDRMHSLSGSIGINSLFYSFKDAQGEIASGHRPALSLSIVYSYHLRRYATDYHKVSFLVRSRFSQLFNKSNNVGQWTRIISITLGVGYNY